MNLLPEIIMQAARLGIISLEEAEARIPQAYDWDSRQRVEVIRALHPQVNRAELQANLLKKFDHLPILLPHIEDSLLPQAISILIQAGGARGRIAYQLFHLLRHHLTDTLWQHLIDTLNGGRLTSEARAACLHFLRPYVPASLLEKIAPVKPYRTPAVPDPTIAAEFQELIDAPDDIDADVQAQSYQQLLDSVMQVRSGIPDFDDVSYQVGFLGDIVEIMPEKFLAKAVEVAQQLKSNREKSWALGDIALRMEGADKQATLQLALDAALGYPPVNSREPFLPGEMSAFMRLVPQLTGDLAAQAAGRLPDYNPFGTDEVSQYFNRLYDNSKRQAMGALAANLPEATVRKYLDEVG